MRVSIVALVCLLTLPGRVIAQEGDVTPASVRANEQLDAGDFEDASRTVEKALKQPGLSDGQRVLLLRLWSLASLYMGKEHLARLALERLLEINPRAELPKGTPPKLKALFVELQASAPPVLQLTARDRGPSSPVEVTLTSTPVLPESKARLNYRFAASGPFNTLDLTFDASGKALAQVPRLGLERSPETFEYSAELLDRDGHPVASAGDAAHPRQLALEVPAPVAPTVEPPPPLWKNPWLWTAVGVVVVGGATTGIVVAATAKPPSATLPVTIRIAGEP